MDFNTVITRLSSVNYQSFTAASGIVVSPGSANQRGSGKLGRSESENKHPPGHSTEIALRGFREAGPSHTRRVK
jgi:hypothetical protein